MKEGRRSHASYRESSQLVLDYSLAWTGFSLATIVFIAPFYTAFIDELFLSLDVMIAFIVVSAILEAVSGVLALMIGSPKSLGNRLAGSSEGRPHLLHSASLACLCIGNCFYGVGLALILFALGFVVSFVVFSVGFATAYSFMFIAFWGLPILKKVEVETNEGRGG